MYTQKEALKWLPDKIERLDQMIFHYLSSANGICPSKYLNVVINEFPRFKKVNGESIWHACEKRTDLFQKINPSFIALREWGYPYEYFAKEKILVFQDNRGYGHIYQVYKNKLYYNSTYDTNTKKFLENAKEDDISWNDFPLFEDLKEKFSRKQ